MGKRLNVILNSNPANGVSFLFSVNVVSENETNYFSGVFKTTPVNSDDILIGFDATATAANLLIYFLTFTVPDYITFSRTGNTVHCDVEPDNSSEGNINISWSGTAGITFEIINVVDPISNNAIHEIIFTPRQYAYPIIENRDYLITEDDYFIITEDNKKIRL